MVLCFLIHTVCPLGASPPGESRVLYCRVFGPDEGFRTGEDRWENRGDDWDWSQEDGRLLRKESISLVARQVQSAVLLSHQALGQLPVDAVPGEEALVLQEAESGVVRLRAGEPLPREASAVWLSVHSLSFTLVCLDHHNLLLAQATLRTLTRLCLDHLHLLGQGSQVLLKSHRVDVLLSRLLPHGQLLFLTQRLAQSLEKEVAGFMAK